MKSAQLFLHFLVDDLVVMSGALPAHSAKQSDCFHVVPPFANNLSDTKRGIERDNLLVVLKAEVLSGELDGVLKPIKKIANPAEPVNGQDKRRKCAAVHSRCGGHLKPKV